MIDIAQEFRRCWAYNRAQWPSSGHGFIGPRSWHDVKDSIAHRIAWLTAFDCDNRTEPELPALVAEFRRLALLLDRRYRREYPPGPVKAVTDDESKDASEPAQST